MTASTNLIRTSARLQRYGPWAVVTGASDGIGRATSLELSREGFNVVLVARRRARLEALAQELESEHEVKTHVIAADLGTKEGTRLVLRDTEGMEVGLLVAAAGFGTSGAFVDAELEIELDMLEVNCGSLLELSLAFSKRFASRGRGGIVLLSSLVGFQGVPRAAHYAATKAYVQSLAEGLSHELRPLGVDVVASAPGPVESGFAQRANMRLGSALHPEQVARETVAALGRKRVVRPGLLTKFLLWSLSLLPRSVQVRVVGGVMHGMTRHQLAGGDPASA